MDFPFFPPIRTFDFYIDFHLKYRFEVDGGYLRDLLSDSEITKTATTKLLSIEMGKKPGLILSVNAY